MTILKAKKKLDVIGRRRAHDLRIPFGVALAFVTRRNDQTARWAFTTESPLPGRESASQLTGTKASLKEQASLLTPTASKRRRLLDDLGLGVNRRDGMGALRSL
jgi:hypothetical protein